MPENSALRVLCLDIEGGYGGSSRSLYESIRHLDTANTAAEVWCRRQGPIQHRYQAIGVTARVTPAMPRFSALPRLSRNVYAAARAALEFRRAGAFLKDLQGAAACFDAVHFNLVCQKRFDRGAIRIAGVIHAKLTHVAVTFVLQADNHCELPLLIPASCSGTSFWKARREARDAGWS